MKNSNDNFISIADLWHLCISHWRWYVVSLLLCLIAAEYRVSHATLTYTSSATILVIQEKEGKSSNNKAAEEFRSMSLVNQDVNVNNITKEINSLDVLIEVARHLIPTADEQQLLDRALYLRKRLSVETAGKNTSVIDLEYTDYSPEKAQNTLALIIQVYNDKWGEDNILLTQKTSSFIDSRLELLKSELDKADDSISSFKSENQITELGRVADIYLQQRNQSDAEILRLTNQRALAESLRTLLENNDAPHTLLPVNSGINNSMIESQISLYNNQVMQYYSHLNYTSTQNPRMIIQEKELRTLRSNILYAVQNHINSLNIQINTIENYNDNAIYNISSNPLQAKYLTSIEREQKVKEGLYLYLLQKKEESEISSTYQHSNIKILDSPYVSGSSSSKKTTTLAAALLLGILLPTLIIFIHSMMDKTIRKRTNIESYPKLLLLGDVPVYGKQRGIIPKLKLLYKIGLIRKAGWIRRAGLIQEAGLVVGKGKQDAVNESFRILRTKLTQDTDNKTYMITSFDKEDGKTFISTNLALAMAVNGQHVLFIDCDLRHGAASRLWDANGPGLSDYLEGREKDFSSLLFHPDDYPTLDILPSGDIPSNPTELLSKAEFGKLFAAQRPNYDIILIDTPKATNLADTEIIAEQADTAIFVIRVGKTERQHLDTLETAQESGKYAHLALVINGSNE
jgi:capsular exopolysaccharide synthesis family protein